MTTNMIDEKFNQSEALYQAGKYKETVALLEDLAASSLSHGERMLTARMIVSILYHNILHNYPRPFTPEYAMFRKYIAISAGLFDLAELDYQAAYLQEELELHDKILEQMEENEVIQVPRAIQNWQGLWRIRKEQKASRELG
jgi:hypothetical protein